MKIIILCGGTGKRFWPKSRKSSPKQFLSIVDNKPLVRLMFGYLSSGFSPHDIFISTGNIYKKEIKKILPEIPEENFIFEPESKDTGPAVLLATSYVSSKFPNEEIAILWSDHYLKHPDIFVKTLKEASLIVKETKKTVAIGVPARFPTPNRGYINFGKKLKSLDLENKINLVEFINFKEKPSLEIAKQYVESGAFSWNPGYCITCASNIFGAYQKYAKETYNIISQIKNEGFSNKALKLYLGVEKKSFDYIFNENLLPNNTYLINSDMGWSDVGEWIAYKEALEITNEANVLVGNCIDLNSKDTLVYNDQKNKIVATVGLDGMIVVNTKDAIAVFHKDNNPKLKELLKLMEEKNLSKYL